MMVLFSHVRTGVVGERHSGKCRALDAEWRGSCSAIPIVEPEVVHTIGLVMPMREPMSPLSTALAAEARRTAAQFMA